MSCIFRAFPTGKFRAERIFRKTLTDVELGHYDKQHKPIKVFSFNILSEEEI